jgi:protein TonB
MTAFALHLPERHGVSRWILAGATIIAAHAAIIASVILWYARQPVVPNIMPAIAVSLAPVEASSPEIQNQDVAVGPTMQQAEEQPKQPPKAEEQKIEQVEQPPMPQQQADVTLPDVQPKEVEKPKPEVMPPAPETRAPPKTERVAQFSQAASNAYMALLLGHLERFKRYPSAAHGAAGKVLVQFELNRAGEVIGSTVAQSSGNAALDQEALAIVRRASPFPHFPSAKPGAQDTYTWPAAFYRPR